MEWPARSPAPEATGGPVVMSGICCSCPPSCREPETECQFMPREKFDTLRNYALPSKEDMPGEHP